MTEPMQLTTDGREIPMSALTRHTEGVQRVLLRELVRYGPLRTSEAGRVVHAHRGHCGRRADFPQRTDVLACCGYGPIDGNRTLHRLANKGLVRRIKPGVWEYVPGE